MTRIQIDNLETESDVEQKYLYAFLSQPSPYGLNIHAAEIKTKTTLTIEEIGKGTSKKRFVPDYVIFQKGLPVLVVEAKAPKENAKLGFEEAALYAHKINSKFGSSINPCHFVMATNGKTTLIGKWDNSEPTIEFTLSSHAEFSQSISDAINLIGRERLAEFAENVHLKMSPRAWHRPIAILGGQSVRNEEIPLNTFGQTLAFDFRHLFNPKTLEERSYIAQNAYVKSNRRERYAQPIDRVIRAARSASEIGAKLVTSLENPKEIHDQLRNRKPLEKQILLLIGSVGSGKSTFVDYLKSVSLPKDVKEQTTWAHLDMNEAPLSKEHIYNWVSQHVCEEIELYNSNFDFEDIDGLSKIFSVEFRKFRKSLGLLDPNSNEFKQRVTDKLNSLNADSIIRAKCLERRFCGEAGKLLIIVLDNCDKRNRDDQLLMFEVAQWIQRQFHCLVVLPIRDVTYDLHRFEPPLDTALKDLSFRIEPPMFTKVLEARFKLALTEMQTGNNTLSYRLPNGFLVEYPDTDLGMYLSSILRSLFEYDYFVRRLIIGLAGKDIRKALEIFLEICKSGYLSETILTKIRINKGRFPIPYHILAKVLFRGSSRFYNGDVSYVKNLFQSNRHSGPSSHFTRLAILKWLKFRHRTRGPTGVKGYFKASELVSSLTAIGQSEERIQDELKYLVNASCILTEDLKTEIEDFESLISISPTGYVHLTLANNSDYWAACSEDIWYDHLEIAKGIAGRIGNRRNHFKASTAKQNIIDLKDYLEKHAASCKSSISNLFTDIELQKCIDISDLLSGIDSGIKKLDEIEKSVSKH